MPINIDDIWIYRMTHYQNLETILQNGMLAKNKVTEGMTYEPIGNPNIINKRSLITVSCYPELILDDFVPFYFAIRTPMLYNIHTGWGTDKIDQSNIVYFCCKVSDLVANTLEWCFTNGNAAISTTIFYRDVEELALLDWDAIRSNDFKNSDYDRHRKDKKQAEFLVKDDVPIQLVKKVVVCNNEMEKLVKAKISNFAIEIEVEVSNPTANKYYFNV